MPLERKALVVTHTPGDTASGAADALTDLLNDDWRIVSTTAMGGAGGTDGPAQFAALVVVERQEKKATAGFGTG